MKETGESGSTKNKTVILLLIILLILLWFVGEILVSYHWMKVNRYPVQVRNLRYADTVTDAGFKMVVISDLHDHEFGKDNEKLIRRNKKAILVDDPVASFRFVESYKKLAAKVEYRMAKNEQKVLVVTSVSENEGKSTVAANLAITLAEQSKRVLLIDGDIRRPSQFLIFGMEPKEENELGEYLRGNGSLADVMVPCTRKHMLFMGGKNCYSSSTEMLNSESFFKLMAACRKFVDYVIIDTPPAGIIGDAQIFAHCADAVMIVAKQNYMLAEDINEVMDDFRDNESKILGVVLNGVRSFSGLVDSPVGHYYGKYSKYGRYGNYGRSKGM